MSYSLLHTVFACLDCQKKGKCSKELSNTEKSWNRGKESTDRCMRSEECPKRTTKEDAVV